MQWPNVQIRTAIFLLFALFPSSDAQAPSTSALQFVNVTDGAGLQAALRSGVQHIIVRRHLNLGDLPIVPEQQGAEFNAGVAPFNGTTVSLTVRLCLFQPQTSIDHPKMHVSTSHSSHCVFMTFCADGRAMCIRADLELAWRTDTDM
jgi:hypothetical protein